MCLCFVSILVARKWNLFPAGALWAQNTLHYIPEVRERQPTQQSKFSCNVHTLTYITFAWEEFHLERCIACVPLVRRRRGERKCLQNVRWLLKLRLIHAVRNLWKPQKEKWTTLAMLVFYFSTNIACDKKWPPKKYFSDLFLNKIYSEYPPFNFQVENHDW